MNWKNCLQIFVGLLLISSFSFVVRASDNLRYQALKTVLKKYNRAFTMIDVGARENTIALNAAQDFSESVFVMVENDYEHPNKNNSLFDTLQDLRREGTAIDNAVLLYKTLNVQDVAHLSTCEHFDVVFCSVIEQYGSQWQQFVQAFLLLGDNIFIEVSGHSDFKISSMEIEAFLKKIGGKIVFESQDHFGNKIFYFAKQKNNITRKYWVAEENTRRQLKVISNFDDKFMVKSHKNYTRISSWIPGINLLTYKMLNGIYPRRREIKRLMHDFTQAGHPDPFLWNIVIQGKQLELIDWDPLAEFKFDPIKCLKFNILALSLRDPLEIRKFILNFNNEREKYVRNITHCLDAIMHSMYEKISYEDMENEA